MTRAPPNAGDDVGDIIARALDADPGMPFDVVMSRTPCAVALPWLHGRLAARRFDLTTEKLTQAGVETALIELFGHTGVSREHRLGPGDIPDFLVQDRLVVEVKGRKHRAGPTLRQLERYAVYPQVTGLILATSRAMQMPATVKGKPLLVLNLGRAWL